MIDDYVLKAENLVKIYFRICMHKNKKGKLNNAYNHKGIFLKNKERL